MTTVAANCERCGDTGWEPVEADGIRRVRRCGCRSLPSHPETVPLEFRSARLENYVSKPANARAFKLAQGFASSERDFYGYGPVGTGKTRLACSLLNEHYQDARSGLFIRVPMLLVRLTRELVGDTEREEASLFDQCCSVSLLVLDDVGGEKGSDYTRRTLLTIYDERGDRGLRTIWTSNLDLAQLSKFFEDDRLSSRIAGRSDVVRMDGDDWRVQKRERR